MAKKILTRKPAALHPFINKPQTYLYWFVYIVAFAAMIWYLIKMAIARKKEQSED